MSHGKQFTLYSHVGGPNGWWVLHLFNIADTSLYVFYNRKVAHVLDELNLTYETVYLKFDQAEHKAPEYTKYNPNGRIPALIDHHNNDFVLWYASTLRN